MAVVGGGMVGVTSALLAARAGWRVTLLEAEPRLWSRASAANEGKVHLGPVFALGDDATHDVLQEGAASFADILDQAVDTRLPWEDLASDPFDYVVMRDSLADPTTLAAAYTRMNTRWAARDGARYLGQRLDRLVDPAVRRDPASGLPTFRSAERAVEPRALARRLVDAVVEHPRIEVRTRSEVLDVDDGERRVVLGWRTSDGSLEHEGFDAVVNAAWERQQTLLPRHERTVFNFRLKAALRLPATVGGRTVTLVQGPYGDVVRHHAYTYVSWYPAGRLTHEHAEVPGPDVETALDLLAGRRDLVETQLKPLQDLGLLPHDVDPHAAEVVGGVIVGHGPTDIDDPASGLHRRAAFGPRRVGRQVVPISFKLTTAPLAARLAVAEVARVLGR